jgi:hypothetical protein
MVFLTFISVSCNQKILIIDTANNDPYIYRTIITLSEKLGFLPIYKNIYEIEPNSIDNFPTIIFSFHGSYFTATAQELGQKHSINHPLLKRINSFIDEISKQNNKTVLLIMPSTGKSAALLGMAHQLLARLGTFEKPQMDSTLENFTKKMLLPILQSDASKSFRYDTALLYAQEKPYDEKIWEQLEKNGEIIGAPLPLDSTIFKTSHELEPLYPLGFYLKNKANGNQFFITHSSAVHFADIQESFIYNPVDHTLRKKILEAVYTLLAEFYNAAETKNLIQNKKKLIIPDSLQVELYRNNQRNIQTQRASILDQKYYWIIHEGISCGWLTIGPYEKNMNKAVENLLKCGLNMLWLELRPEWQLSVQALDPDGKKAFFKRVKTFTKTLVAKSQELKLPIPKLFVGMEMTGNFIKYPPCNPAIDMYGSVYSKIPSPLDFEKFWKPELLDVFDAFYAAWQNSIGNGIPLAGIFLDFEMYHAQNQTGQFLATMDFSDLAWQLFVKKMEKPELAKFTKTQERFAYLMDNNLLNTYFQILQKKAEKIGAMIRNHVHTKLPNSIIAGYNLNLPHNWFYKGLLAGLSSPENPVIFATFSNEFYPHYDWLTKNNIHLLHMPVILLSKLQKKEDFTKIDDLLQFHDGIWFNRISRLEEPRPTNGKNLDFDLESTPLDTQTFISLLNQALSKYKP